MSQEFQITKKVGKAKESDFEERKYEPEEI